MIRSAENCHPAWIAGFTVILGLFAASPLCAQVIYGTAHISGAPHGATQGSAQTSVVLVDTAGSVVAASTTDERGAYLLHAPGPGSFRVRARRIGFVPDSSERIVLAPDEAVLFNPQMQQIVVALANVKVEEAQRCVIAPEAGAMAFRLWQEVQNALTGTLSNTVTTHSFNLARYERSLDPQTKRVIKSSTSNIHVQGTESYRSVPAESLAADGFVKQSGSYLLYAAPDARTLTSDAFARTHCLRPVSGASGSDSIGLAFEPVTLGSRIDVEGTLWLTRSTSKLMYLAFEYVDSATHADSITRELDSLQSARSRFILHYHPLVQAIPPVTGRVEYLELPDGSWIVDRWQINAPVLRKGSAYTYNIVTHNVPYVAALWETGGDVTMAPADAPAAKSFSLNGVLIDSVTRKGIPGFDAVVETPDTHAVIGRATTDSSGHFALANLSPGIYVVDYESPRLDTLGVIIPPIPLSAVAGDEVLITGSLPPSRLAEMCVDSTQTDSVAARIIHGVVRDVTTGAPIESASVHAAWLVPSNPSALGGGPLRPFDLTVTTDSAGRYLMCGLPTARTLVITTTAARHDLVDIKVSSSSAPITTLNFKLPNQAASDSTLDVKPGAAPDSGGTAPANTETPPRTNSALRISANAVGIIRIDSVPLEDAA